MDLPNLTLVLGGARSGKSRHGEGLVTASAPAPWIYIATAQAYDAEMRERIEHHRTRRGEGWVTIEEPIELARTIEDAPQDAPILVDCLTLWLTNLMLCEHDLEAAFEALEAAIAHRSSMVVAVSNEVGFGIVPENALARRFRDEQGRLNQRLAAAAGAVVLMVAGLPLIVK